MFTRVFLPNNSRRVEVSIGLPSGSASGDGTFSTGKRRRLDEEVRSQLPFDVIFQMLEFGQNRRGLAIQVSGLCDGAFSKPDSKQSLRSRVDADDAVDIQASEYVEKPWHTLAVAVPSKNPKILKEMTKLKW